MSQMAMWNFSATAGYDRIVAVLWPLVGMERRSSSDFERR